MRSHALGQWGPGPRCSPAQEHWAVEGREGLRVKVTGLGLGAGLVSGPHRPTCAAVFVGCLDSAGAGGGGVVLHCPLSATETLPVAGIFVPRGLGATRPAPCSPVPVSCPGPGRPAPLPEHPHHHHRGALCTACVEGTLG